MSQTKQQHVVVLSGAGISAESGIQTFRAADGLWENHPIEDVATPEGWQRNPALVLEFYNQRRRQLYTVEPNAGHLALAQLETTHRVTIVTQNVDNLHERAGSTTVVHLHGELDIARSTADESLLTPLKGKDIKLGDQCALGSQLRPHIVWFGESVPLIERAEAIVQTADILIVVGTSLQVYPAAGLIGGTREGTLKFLINPELPPTELQEQFTCIAHPAGTALPELVKRLQSRSREAVSC
ncbi:MULTISPECIES: NAD-dependent deacylase [unclassified Lentimonas]|uniref:SIR2 family NAD-dependent protein deacylase n=1 Tax=unclassified Lentimonas TaxID=2630993 RepID=UPI001327E7FA|nr:MULTISPECIES: NAD-dependent deacylase [unclassified Lentimonas]CAA6691915.1 NAD-dependent protein deacetylase of SIR2 family [Lentimonas sp. CC10]CAA6697647.1 NAD-dependent protein deacetylase of SIR2 family [Lentimonas sp. CC19]CAA7071479.1 NAD-dependent protein deacetylase of SIR2 family [Lentimonas sp. CC11]